MRWVVHGERTVYESPWVSVALVDVEVPGGERFEHHVVRMPGDASGVVATDGERVLLIHRHRFITDSTGWEIPAGRVEVGEDPIEAARRETLEETGWRPGPLSHLFSYFPSIGLIDQRFNVFLAAGADHVGEPTDFSESDRVEWIPTSELPALVRQGAIQDGYSLTALLWFLQLGKQAQSTETYEAPSPFHLCEAPRPARGPVDRCSIGRSNRRLSLRFPPCACPGAGPGFDRLWRRLGPAPPPP